MRGLRSTIALLVVLIGLGAYIYFVTWKQSDTTDAASKQEKVFASLEDEKKVFLIPAYQDSSFNKDTFSLREKQLLKFERDKVDRVELAAAGKNLAIAKEGTEWKLTTPVQTRADFGAVEGLMGRLQSAQ